jgi:photosystem II stability/assembly factor-like uncharacterized protein
MYARQHQWRCMLIRIRQVGMAAFTLFILASGAGVSDAQQYPLSTYQEMQWRMIGPFRGGRTRAATGVRSQPNVFYVGQGDGGVWKSNDYGRTWTPIFDDQPSQSIGAIAVAPSDPNILYAASGEGLQRPDLSVGDGIYKSTDAGKTWTHLGLRDGQQIPALVVDPRDPNRVFAAVLGHPYGPNKERGIFLSTDGGQTWNPSLYKDEDTGGSDVQIDPTNPDVMYASMWKVRQGPWEDGNKYDKTGGGLFKSTDGGANWHPLTNGLPANIVQIYVAISASQPSRLYATVGTTDRGDYGSGAGLGVYRSDDSGETWTRATTDPRPAFRIGGGDLPVPKVDPKNPDVVYSTSIVTMRSTDGGKTWVSYRGAPGGDDYQNIWINPIDPKIILLVSDQGALVTVNGGESWSSWYNQPTAQIYHVGVSNTFPYRVCGGQQESGSVCISSRGNDGTVTFRDWHPVGAIEYGYVAPDPLDPDIIYGAGRKEVSKFHWTTGQVQNVTPIPDSGPKYRADRTEPIMFSPVDPHILYYATNVLFKTTNGGESWQTISPDLTREKPGIPASLGNLAADDPRADKQRGVIYSLAPSFKDVNAIWAGTDDGQFWLTRDAGKNWANITPSNLTPWSKVTQMSASHFDEQSAYASVSRFRIDDLHPYIYRTHDGGKTWQLITAGLPDNAPVDTVREDPVRKGLLFAGTETSVWVSFDDGDRWQSLQLNLPHTSMRDLWIHDDDLIVATHGRSFWILDDITPLRQIGRIATGTFQVGGVAVGGDSYLFIPALAYRVKRDTYTDTPMPPDEPMGKNPPHGAIIDYFLAPDAKEPVTLEIRDSRGVVVRRYASTDKPDVTKEQLEKQLIPLYWLRPQPVLSTAPGMHRWVWDLHYPTPNSTRHEYPISAVPHDTPRLPLGPPALPGEYTVRLTADGRNYNEVPLTVKMDPRVKISPAALEQQFKAETRLASMMTRSTHAIMEARSLHDQLEKLASQASTTLSASIKDLEKKASIILDGTGGNAAAPAPTLTAVNGSVTTLYADIDRADAAPTSQQAEAVAKIDKDFEAVNGQWGSLKYYDLSALNRQLSAAGQPEIHLDSHADSEEDEGQDID